MNCFRLSERIADYLIGTFLFRLHGFTAALDVRVCDVCVDGRALGSSKTAALLVLDEDRVLCGIAFDQDSAACFHSDLPGLPYVRFSSISNVLPMGHEDESCLDYIPTEALERLLDQLNRILIPQALRSSQRNEYTLKAHLPEEILPSLQGPPYEKLRKKYLIGQDGSPTAYGRANGLFFRYTAGADGSLERHPVSSTVTFQDYLRAANWGGQGGDFDALQALLDTSMGELFRHHSEEWNRLSGIMTELSGLQSYPAFAPDNILEDYPELVYRLRCKVADGNPENSRIMKLTGELLECIGQVLGDERTAQRFEVLRMPLYGYFEEAALR